MLGSIAISAVAVGDVPSSEPATRTLTSARQLALFLVVILVGGPLAEELGWRGFALDRLQAQYSALSASLILTLFSLLWHVPLFFMKGTAQGEMGFASYLFLAWSICHVAGHIFHTWVYNNCQRSIFAAVLLHFMSNVSFSLVTGIGGALPEATAAAQAFLYVVIAAIVTIVWGPLRLVRSSSQSAGGPTSR